MTATPIVAPYAPTYTASEPYISAAEFKFAGTGVTTSTIVPGGTADQQANALSQKIAAGSSAADGYCNQQLACTPVILTGYYRARNGYVRIPLTQLPIVQLTSAGFGIAGVITPLDTLDGTLFPFPNVVDIPWSGADGKVFAQIEYLAGFPNTFMTADSIASDTTVEVTNTLGVVAGMQLVISDPGSTEYLTVESTTDTVITFTTAMVNPHPTGTNVSALPAAIKQAVILLTAVLIKNRGQDAVVIQSISGGETKQAIVPMATRELSQAFDLLNAYRRVA